MKKAVFFLLLFGLAVYVIYLIAVPHYQYYAFKSDVYEQVRVATGRPEDVMASIMRIVEDYEVPVEKKDIQLIQDENKYIVKTSWSVTVDFFTVHQETFRFSVDTSRPR